MNIKNIKSFLTHKHNDWLDSITDTLLREGVRRNSLIAGGAIVSLMQGDSPNDLDVYLMDKEVALKLVIYYVKQWNKDARHRSKIGIRLRATQDYVDKLLASDVDTLIDMLLCEGYTEHTVTELSGMRKQELVDILLSADYGRYYVVSSPEELDKVTVDSLYRLNEYSNGVSLFIRSAGAVEEADDGIPMSAGTAGTESSTVAKEGEKPDYRPVFLTNNAMSLKGKVQVILRFIGTPEEITANFDYVHCTCTYVPHTKELTLPSKALASIMTKELMYVGSRYPVCSLFRLRKFINRGYHINVGQILKMVFQIKALDLYNIAVMEDQLLGVDSLYMASFVRSIKEDAEKGEEVTETYLMELISDMFDTELSN